MLDAFPRLHPLLLHVPIGVLVALVWLQLWGKFAKSSAGDSPARRPLVLLLAVSTFFASLTGWLLHESASYPDPVELHEYFGVALLVATLLMVWAEFKKPAAYEPLLWLALILVFPTGHLGGTLTHGEAYLFGPSESETASQPGESNVAADEPKTESYETVRPILEKLCLHCHGDRKQRGGLALHTEQAVLNGGNSGIIWTPGDLEGSLIWQLLNSPVDSDEHMPPSNKSQPNAAELARLKAWLEQGPE